MIIHGRVYLFVLLIYPHNARCSQASFYARVVDISWLVSPPRMMAQSASCTRFELGQTLLTKYISTSSPITILAEVESQCEDVNLITTNLYI